MSTALLTWPSAPAPTIEFARTVARPRRVMFDVMRLLAAYSIIWLHTPRSSVLANSTVLGRFAVPFFVCATVFFIWQGLVDTPDRRFSPYVRSRFTRIYVPFLAWSGIYLAFKAVKGLALPDQPNEFPGLEFLWTGSFYHLWFMPFILLVSLAVFPLGKLLVECPRAEWITAAICTVFGGMLAVSTAPAWVLGTSEVIWAWNALPAVFWGITLSIAFHRGSARRLEQRSTAIAALVLAALCTAWIWQFGRNNLAENLAGLAATVVALAPWNSHWLQRIGQFGPLAYGIYLSHLLFIKSAEAVVTKIGGGTSWPLDIAVFMIAAVGSTLLAWCLSQTRVTRWLVA